MKRDECAEAEEAEEAGNGQNGDARNEQRVLALVARGEGERID